MNKYLIIIVVVFLVFSCNSKQGNMSVHGKIINFQKGKVYLEKMKDTLLVKVDSVLLDGKNTFTLSDNVESPQIYYLSISDSDKYVPFFGEKGEISIISNLKTFGFKPVIKGSKNQKVYDDFKKMNTKFNNKRLDLIKERFDFMVKKDSTSAKNIDAKLKSLERRKYLYTINFATKNANYEVAPYLVLSEIPNANPKLLDTIKKAMSPKVRESLYGKKLIAFLEGK